MSALGHKRRAVVIGGGTGAPVSIRALLGLGLEVSAVVAMADDGGSTGILRERAGAIPPGDIRKCLVAMARDEHDPFTRAFSYRFDYAQNHALGNLILTALADTTLSFTKAIEICERVLDTRGHVYPSTLESVVLEGYTCDGRHIMGQANVSSSDCALEQVMLIPRHPDPYEPALEAIRECDLVVLGPGSLFTSIIPNLLVPGVVEAIAASGARTVFVCGLADMQGETWGLSPFEHVSALLDHGMRGLLDVVFLHHDSLSDDPRGAVTSKFARVTGAQEPVSMNARRMSGELRRLNVNPRTIASIKAQGPRVVERNFVDRRHPTWHDSAVLAQAFKEVLDTCHSPQR